MLRAAFVFLVVGIMLGILGVAFVTKNLCPLPLGTSIWIDTEKVSDGYLLVSPYYGANDFDEPGEVLLLDTDGETVHRWATKYQTLVAYLQPDGHLFAGLTPPLDIGDYPSGGSTGIIQELDWDGNVLWEYEDSQMTHDFEVMPDGRIAYIRWHEASPAFAANVQGGMRLATTSVWTNELVVINRDKEIEWTWKPDDHLDPRDFVLSPLVPRNDWTHINSVRYVAENPLTHTSAFLVSARDISTVFLVDAGSGAIIWQSPKDLFSLQHDATLTDSGTILVFDNGFHRSLNKALLISRAVEVDPRTNRVVWQYPKGENRLEAAQFASSIMSGAERLSNGNTLITASMINTILEVTRDGEVAARYTNDFRDEAGRMRVVFKSRKYDARGTEWGKRVGGLHLVEALCAR